MHHESYLLPIGPYHPLLKEPEYFKVFVKGEEIVDLDFDLGFNYRGVEELVTKRTWEKSVFLANRICGFCVTGDTEIILGDGEVIKMEEFAKSKDKFHKNPSGLVLSWDGHSPKLAKILAFQKLKSPKSLLKIKTRSGNSLLLTKDHKVLIDTKKGQKMIEADNLKKEDEVYAPREIEIYKSNNVYILDFLPKKFTVYLKKEAKKRLKKKLKGKFSTLKKVSKKLKVDYNKLTNFGRPLPIKKLNRLLEHINLDREYIASNISAVSFHGFKVKTNPTLDEEIMYILGLIASDGWIGKYRNNGKYLNYRIGFTNQNKAILEKFREFFKKRFGQDVKKRVLESGTPRLRINNPIIAYIGYNLGLNGLDSNSSDIKPIFKLPKKYIAAFLRGYFDGDGSCGFKEYEYGTVTEIKYDSTDKKRARRLQLLLKRLGIASNIWGGKAGGFVNALKYSIKITNKLDRLKFIKRVGSYHSKKKKILNKIKNFYSNKNTFSSFFQRAPRKCGKLIEKLRKKHNIPRKELIEPSELYKIEKCKKRILKNTARKIIRNIEKFVASNDKDLRKLKRLASDSFYLDPIKSIQEVKADDNYVYDITVDKTHTFIPNGAFVVSNCGIAHSMAFCQAIEEIGEIEVPKRAKYIRVIMSELNRLQSHLILLALIGYSIGFDTLFQWCIGAREKVLENTEKIAGNRIHYSMVCIGGVRKDITPKIMKELEKSLKNIKEDVKKIHEIFRTNKIINKRLEGVGILSKSEAKELGVVGPVARGSNVNNDIRKTNPYAAYPDLDFKVILKKKGDCLARNLVRTKECFESIKILEQTLDLPKGKIKNIEKVDEIPKGESTMVVEAPRGEDMHYVVSKGGKSPEKLRIRVPTYANLIALNEMVKGGKLADIPVIIQSIDPCFGCTDRMQVIDTKTKNKKVVKFDKFLKGERKKLHI